MYKKLVIAFFITVLVSAGIIYLLPNKYEAVKVGDPISEVIEDLGKPMTTPGIIDPKVISGLYIWQDIETYKFSKTFPFYEAVYSSKSYFVITVIDGLVMDKEYVEDIDKLAEELFSEDEQEIILDE